MDVLELLSCFYQINLMTFMNCENRDKEELLKES